MTLSTGPRKRFALWFFQGMRDYQKKTERKQEQDVWWKVMTLTGVDYFSSLGYAPGIAFLAAGFLSPLATFLLVLLTIFGALPVYKNVASNSPHGEGSISMLEHLLPGWNGKVLVLCLLGFACTDFAITMTLSAADAATHLVQNPWMPEFLQHRMGLTMLMLLFLGGIFLRGFRTAMGVCVGVVMTYLALNAIVLTDALIHVGNHPDLLSSWQSHLFELHGSFTGMLLMSLLIFPRLALGLAGFETGVAVMPHVLGDAGDDPNMPEGRIRNTNKMLTAAALIMSFFLIGSSFATTILIPPAAFSEGGAANGRALAYLAHTNLGHTFGTIYDISTILILWFAGASAMAGLINLVPRYLPRYGMAPDWARAKRPLIVFITAVAFVITIAFNADVDAQGSAYATGVLVVITSAALAATLTSWQHKLKRFGYMILTALFTYVTVANCFERPDGLKIAALFILIMFLTSLISRVMRSTELRVQMVVFDEVARKYLADASEGTIRIVAHRPGNRDYVEKAQEAHDVHNIDPQSILFLEVGVSDASEFGEELLEVKGTQEDGFPVLHCHSPAVPNAIAALLLTIRNKTGKIPHLYLGWTEGNPVSYILKYLFLGEGETAPITREILREIEPDPDHRPRIHVG